MKIFNETCTICIEDFENDILLTPVTTLKCKHMYHTECLLKYLYHCDNTARKCPTCRKTIKCKELHNIVTNYYMKINNDYTKTKYNLKKLEYNYTLENFKFKIKKLFTSIDKKQAFEILLKDEEHFAEIAKYKLIMFQKKKELKKYKQLY